MKLAQCQMYINFHTFIITRKSLLSGRNASYCRVALTFGETFPFGQVCQYNSVHRKKVTI
jgi:hypothetical protein